MADDGTKFAWDEEKGDWKQVEGDEEEELEDEEEVRGEEGCYFDILLVLLKHWLASGVIA